MAHPEQQRFFEQLAILFPDHFVDNVNVLEIGSQDINGTVRDFFQPDANYLGLDLGIAKGVDWTIPGELIELPDQWARVCISTECFEHAATWPQILLNMIRITQENGLLILSIAGHGRASHGTVDSDLESSPWTTSYYKNLGPDDITEKIRLGHYFKRHGFQVNSEAGDTYFWGIRSAGCLNTFDDGWQSPLDRLARAQGQLSQAVNRHNEMKAQLKRAEEALVNRQNEMKTQLKRAEEALETCQQKFEAIQVEIQLKIQQSQQKTSVMEESIRALEQEVYDLKNSRIWRLTAPLRKLKDGLTGA
jgi:predicted GIY-YIG superfamily endonuclease